MGSPLPFACWVVARSLHDLVYLYGPSDACERVINGLPRSRCLFRDGHASLEDARRCAEAGARVAGDWPMVAFRAEVVGADAWAEDPNAGAV